MVDSAATRLRHFRFLQSFEEKRIRKILELMEKTVKDLCLLAGLLGVASAVTGFAAESTKIKESDISVVSYTCVYPVTSPAIGLGFSAMLFLFLAQIAIIFATRRSWMKEAERYPAGKGSSSISVSQKICYVLSWTAFVIALVMLVKGTLMNREETEVAEKDGSYYCAVMKPGIFLTAGFLALAAAFFGIVTVNLTPETTLNDDVNDTEKQPAADVDVKLTP